MLRKVPYRRIPELLRSQKPFQGNSMSAQKSPDGDYLVFSYSTCVAKRTCDGVKWITDDYYSPTTSRHVNLCKEWL